MQIILNILILFLLLSSFLEHVSKLVVFLIYGIKQLYYLKSGSLTDPLNYRGIALQCNLLKAYTSILNKWLTFWLEDNEILEKEQLGFRSGRNCLEHGLTVYLMAQNRTLINKDTFICFIDIGN